MHIGLFGELACGLESETLIRASDENGGGGSRHGFRAWAEFYFGVLLECLYGLSNHYVVNVISSSHILPSPCEFSISISHLAREKRHLVMIADLGPFESVGSTLVPLKT